MVNQLSANHNKSCLFLASEAYFTNSVDSDQTAPISPSRYTLFASTLKLVSDVSKYMRQITKADNFFLFASLLVLKGHMLLNTSHIEIFQYFA